MLHPIYLPFSKEQLKKHFVEIYNNDNNIDNHINKFKKSIGNYSSFETNPSQVKDIRIARQIEKDETFWTASSLMTIFHSRNRNKELIELLKLSFGECPPLKNFNTWDECLNGELKLFFEPNIPSPKEYLDWISKNINTKQFVPYVIEKARHNTKANTFRSNLEGPTNVDALLINPENGFAVFFEAKVLSDISYQTSYDSIRNQLIRNIDVMLSNNQNLHFPLNKRIAENTLFALLTPRIYKDNYKARLYGYKFMDYKKTPSLIAEDLPHRNLNLTQCENIANRMGWLTWENLKEINSNCCKWLNNL